MTGIAAFDGLWGGLYPEALDILGARAMHGKTALAMQVIEAAAGWFQAAKDGRHVGLFSLEMSKRDLSFRMLAKATGIPAEQIRQGQIGGDRASALVAARSRLRRLPLLVYDAPGQTITDIQIRPRVAVRRQKVRALALCALTVLQVTVERQKAQLATALPKGLMIGSQTPTGH